MSHELPEIAGSPSYWQLVANKLRHSPGLLQVARDDITRWRGQGQSAVHRLDQWEVLLADAQGGEPGMHHLMNVLLGGRRNTNGSVISTHFLGF